MVVVCLVSAAFAPPAAAQTGVEPTNSLPNPYQTIENVFKMPDGRTWGATDSRGRLFVGDRSNNRVVIGNVYGAEVGPRALKKYVRTR